MNGVMSIEEKGINLVKARTRERSMKSIHITQGSTSSVA